MRLHRARKLTRGGLAEPHAEPAAQHDALGIQEVHGAGHRRAHGVHRPVEDLLRHLVALPERLLPYARRQAVTALVLHELEEHRLTSVLDHAPGAQLHIAPAGVGLHTAAPAAPADGAVDLHHHVPDLTGEAAPAPAPVALDERAPDARAPEHGDERLQVAPGAQEGLRVSRRADV